MELIGHRGVVIPAAPPENTLAAIDRAFAEGADGVEIDLRLTRDGVAMCVHDPDLRRVLGIPLVVAGATSAALRDIRLPGRHLIPSLGEAARRAAGRGLLVLDCKPAGRRTPALAAAVVAGLRAHQDRDQVVVSSRNREFLRAVEGVPGVRRAWITCPDTPLSALFEVPADVELHPHVRSVLADATGAQRLAELGHTIRAWTVNRPVDAQLLDVLGVAAVITDDPASMRAATVRATSALVG